MSPRALTPDFNEEVVEIRDQTFRLRELSIGEYDDLVKKATSLKTNAITGEEEEQIDNTLLIKLMVIQCVIEPKLTPEQLSAMPTRVVFKLNQTVNRMHYGDEPAKTKEPAPTGEEEPKGNA